MRKNRGFPFLSSSLSPHNSSFLLLLRSEAQNWRSPPQFSPVSARPQYTRNSLFLSLPHFEPLKASDRERERNKMRRRGCFMCPERDWDPTTTSVGCWRNWWKEEWKYSLRRRLSLEARSEKWWGVIYRQLSSSFFFQRKKREGEGATLFFQARLANERTNWTVKEASVPWAVLEKGIRERKRLKNRGGTAEPRS